MEEEETWGISLGIGSWLCDASDSSIEGGIAGLWGLGGLFDGSASPDGQARWGRGSVAPVALAELSTRENLPLRQVEPPRDCWGFLCYCEALWGTCIPRHWLGP